MTPRNRPDRNRPRPSQKSASRGVAGLERLEDRTLLTVFTVDNPLDTTAPGTLRWAVDQANATPGRDTVAFNFAQPGRVTISVSDALPAIEVGDDVDLVGPAGGAGPLVWLDGGMSAEYGLSLSGDRASVRGLGFANFLTAAVRAQGEQNTIGGAGPGEGNVFDGNMYGVLVEPSAHGTSVVGNVLTANQLSSVYVAGFTLDADGLAHKAVVHDVTIAHNLFGFAADGVTLARNFNHAVKVEGAAPGSSIRIDDNTIGGSPADGIRVENASGVRITANRVGADATGGQIGRAANTGNGVAVIANSGDVTIGGPNPGEGNLFAGNFGNGVRVEDSSLTTIVGNTISDNRDDGVGLVNASRNTVAGNTIAHNAGSGVGVYGAPIEDGPTATWGNAITGNSIHDNGGLGIDLVTTEAFGTATIPVFGPTPGDEAYGYAAFPTIDSAAVRSNGTVIRGTLGGAVAGRTYVIHVYANAAVDPDDVWDGVPYGEGEQLVGTIAATAQSDGTLSFQTFFAGATAGPWFTATATDALGNTSEFSAAVEGVPAPDPVITSTLTSSRNPSVIGQSVTFTARVTYDHAAPAGGFVRFMDGDELLAEVPVDASGRATFTTAALGVGAHPITAAYVEMDGALPASVDALIQTVNKAPTRTDLVSSSPGGTTATGQTVTFTATVTVLDSPLAAAGVVTFFDGDTPLGAATLVGGVATLTTNNLSAGRHSITAVYGGSPTHLASASAAVDHAVRNNDPAPSRLSGFVYVDKNNDGLRQSGEKGIPGVTIALLDAGGAVVATTTTDCDGAYAFANVAPGSYTLRETQPAHYIDGLETAGSLGGYDDGDNNTIGAIPVGPGQNGVNYNFGELPERFVCTGDTATIGFWQNKNGQALIKSFNGSATSKALAAWLSRTFPNLYGATSPNNLVGKTNNDVAALFTRLFKASGQKLDAQVLGVALAVYSTTASLGGTAATRYGFTIDAIGTGHHLYNVGGNGAAFGVANNTRLEVIDILAAADARAVNGVLYNGNTALRNMANVVFSGINEQGDIP